MYILKPHNKLDKNYHFNAAAIAFIMHKNVSVLYKVISYSGHFKNMNLLILKVPLKRER